MEPNEKNEVSYEQMRIDAEVDSRAIESRHSGLQESIESRLESSEPGSTSREQVTKEVYREQEDRDRVLDEYERKAWG